MGPGTEADASPDAPRRWFVYMLECAGGRLYTGASPDVARRYAQHCAGKGAAFTRMHKPLRLLAAQACADRGAALRLECLLKKQSPARKRQWAAGCPPIPPAA